MIKKLTTNLSIKLISLLFAIVIWVVVMNITNPVINGFVNVSVNVENENVVSEQNKTYFIPPESRIVKISYKTKSNSQMNIKQSDFYAYIDLNDISNLMDTASNEKNVNMQIRQKISPEIESVVSNVQVEPEVLKVSINDVFRNEYKVQYNFSGNVGQGHSIGNVILSPNIVYVSGSDAALGNIDHIAIDIPVSGNEETFSGVSKVKIYAKDGSVLPNDGVILSAEDIGYSVVLNSTANITLNAITDGTVGTGFRVVDTIINPNTIMIEGPRAFVANIYTFDLPVIDINGLTESKEYKFKLSDILPVGIVSKTNEISVTVVIDNNVINAPTESEVGPHIGNSSEVHESANIIETSSTNESQ